MIKNPYLDADEIVADYHNGLPIAAIAMKHGCAKATVTDQLKQAQLHGVTIRWRAAAKQVVDSEMKARIRLLWQNGKNASQIQEQLGLATRNRVVGHLRRMGLTAKDRLNYRAPYRRNGQRPDALPMPKGGGVELAKLGARQCRWPEGDPGEPGFGFCGCETESALSPYCPAHRQRGTIKRAVMANDAPQS